MYTKINECRDPKEMWRQFRRLSSYEDGNASGVLPLLNDQGEAVFDTKDKCNIIENAFFSGSHVESEQFDDKTSIKSSKTTAIQTVMTMIQKM